MTIHIADPDPDPETDAMARELARLMKTSLTEVVRVSVMEALERHKKESVRGVDQDAKPRGSEALSIRPTDRRK
jgi:hypothetical protein